MHLFYQKNIKKIKFFVQKTKQKRIKKPPMWVVLFIGFIIFYFDFLKPKYTLQQYQG